jgi:hypothetical protein
VLYIDKSSHIPAPVVSNPMHFQNLELRKQVHFEAALLHNCSSSIKLLLKVETPHNVPINTQPKNIPVFTSEEKKMEGL